MDFNGFSKMVTVSFSSYLLTAHLLVSLQGYGSYGSGGGSYGWRGSHDDRMSNLQVGGGLRMVDWSSTKLEHFKKNFYIEDKQVTTRSEREMEEFCRLKEIKVHRFVSHFASIFTFTCRFKAVMSRGL